MRSTTTFISTLVIAAGVLTGCSTPEQKVDSFNRRGQALLQKGDLVKARLEFQNALQINPTAVPALYGLALIAERSRDWQGAYQLFTRVTEMQPAHFEALVKVGKLQLASGQLDKALQTSAAVLEARPDSPDALALRAAVLLKLDDAPAAVTLAGQALARDAGHVDALVVLASERLRAGDAERAVAHLDRGLQGNERNVSLQMIKVQALEKLAHVDRAEEVLRKLVAMFPENTDYRYLLASFHASHRNFDRAEAEYRAVIALKAGAVPPKLELVRYLAATRGAEAASSQLEKFVEAEPRVHELRLSLASVRLQQRDEAAALALWKSVIEQAGTDPAGQTARGAMAAYHLARQDKAAAKALVAEMLARDPRDEQALLLRSTMSLDERNLDAAVADLRTILRDAPDSARAHLLLARAHEMQGLRDLSTQHYASAAQVGRFAAAFAMPYAEHLMKTGRPRQVEPVLKELLRVAPGDLGATRLLAQSYLKTGNLAAAQAVAQEVAKAPAGQVVANHIQGAIQVAQKEFGNSVASFRRAYELAPADAYAMVSLVRSYLVANKPSEALAFLQSVVAASPQNQPARVLLGQLLAQQGQHGAARQALEQAIEHDPRSPLAYQALVTVNLAAGRPHDAMAASERGLKLLPADFSLRLARASLLEMQGKTDEAIAAYEGLLAEHPNAVIVANNLASLLADTRSDSANIRRAYELAQRFRGTELPPVKDTVGWTMHLAGKHREAADFLASAAREAPDLAVVHYHHGMNQIALNNPLVAREALRRSIELAKGTPFAQLDQARRALQGL
jgi:cellulose synthase operon protein C